MTEAEYRDLPLNSSSSIKDFSVDRRKYHKKHILRETVKEKDNKATNMGRIVETLLMEPERFDEEFFMSTVVNIPGGITGDFLYDLSLRVADKTNEEGILTVPFDEIVRAAYETSEFKISFERVAKKLDDPENALYYEECLKVNHLKMTLVTAQDIENAEQIVYRLKNSTITQDYVNLTTGGDFEVHNQFKILDFPLFGLRCKAMLDKVIVNHARKVISPMDLKCTWSVEGFFKEYYLYRRAYIQAFVYKMGLKHLTEDPEHPWYGYEVDNLDFIVCDSINYYQPLIYTTSDDDMKDAMLGFTHNDKQYPGVMELVEGIRWAMDQDIWDISRKNYERRGILNIKD